MPPSQVQLTFVLVAADKLAPSQLLNVINCWSPWYLLIYNFLWLECSFPMLLLPEQSDIYSSTHSFICSLIYSIIQWFSTGGNFAHPPPPPGDIWQSLEMFVVVTIEEGRVVLLASLGLRPGMLLNIPQCIGDPIITKN